MDPTERAGLRNVLVGYFGDNSTADGVREMLGVTRSNPEYHHRYRGQLEAGLRAARAGDEEVIVVVRELDPFLTDLAAAASLIDEILTEYDEQYAAGTS
jgi:hypothetical protein